MTLKRKKYMYSKVEIMSYLHVNRSYSSELIKNMDTIIQ